MTDQELAQMINRVWADLPQGDIDPDPSTKTLLCALFREWGRRDPLAGFAALRKLSDEWYKNSESGVQIQHAPGIPLLYAILAGFGERDPAGAWEELNTQNLAVDNGWILGNSETPEMHAVLDSIFAKLLAESPELATESVESGHRLRYVAMRTLLANMQNPDQRLAHYRRWLMEAKAGGNNHAFSPVFEPLILHYALTGIAMRDPEQAWHVLPASGDPLIFIESWVNHQPEQAIQFLERKLIENDRTDWLFEFGKALLHTHPELAVQCLTMAGPQVLDPFAPAPVLTMKDPQWPVVEGMKPGIPIEELQERWRKALDDPSVPPAILEMFHPLLETTD